jgi:hypothetical protein
MRVVLAMSVAITLAVAGSFSATALADGDPAADILLDTTVFFPQDAKVPKQDQAALLALTKRAQAAGAPVRVAIISSQYDLGTVTALFAKPQQYAEYLSKELELGYHGRVVVVMPQGVGVYWSNHHTDFPGAVEARAVKPGPGGAGLAAAGTAATQRLLQAHAVGASTGGSSDGGSNSTIWIVIGACLAVLAIATVIGVRHRARRRA